jgi:RNA polymerase I-specific transcription initiation factor RRN7
MEEPNDSSFSPHKNSQESEPLLRGKNHTIYSTNDVLGDLPDDYRLVVSKAGRWCGVESNDIALVVEIFERRMLRDLERGPKSGPTNVTKRRDALSDNESWE